MSWFEVNAVMEIKQITLTVTERSRKSLRTSEAKVSFAALVAHMACGREELSTHTQTLSWLQAVCSAAAWVGGFMLSAVLLWQLIFILHS